MTTCKAHLQQHWRNSFVQLNGELHEEEEEVGVGHAVSLPVVRPSQRHFVDGSQVLHLHTSQQNTVMTSRTLSQLID